MVQKNIYYKTDFAVLERRVDEMSMPFRFRFFTSDARKCYVCSYDGERYENCVLDGDYIKFTFDDHNLGVGKIMIAREYYASSEDFRTGTVNSYLKPEEMVFVDADGEQFNVCLTFTNISDNHDFISPMFYMAGDPDFFRHFSQAQKDELMKPATDAAVLCEEQTRRCEEATRKTEEAITALYWYGE